MRVFENSTRLAEINVETGCTAYTSKNGLLCNAGGTEILYAPQNFTPANGTFTVPAGVTRIADYAFVRPRNFSTLIVPGYVSYIGKYAFAMTDSSAATLTSIVFEGVTDDRTLTIDEYAFYGQANLTEVNIPANVTNIGKGAFGNTARLIKVIVDSYGAINYANGAFLDDNGNSYIRELYIGKNVGDVSSIGGVFGTNYLKKVVVDPENTNYYSSTEAEDGYYQIPFEVIDVDTGGYCKAHRQITQNFTDHILKGTPLLAPGSDGVYGLSLANAMMESAWTNDFVELPNDGESYWRLLEEKIKTQNGKI